MGNPVNFIPMIATQAVGSQELDRVAEPYSITSDSDNVIQYDQVMKTKLAINYAVGLEVIHRATSVTGRNGQAALDLACGPAHFTLCLEKYFGFSTVKGMDLSPGMVETARKNARVQKLDERCTFEVGDVTNLSRFKSQSFDLVSFADAAHHMPDLESVGSVLREMDRITKSSGLIFLMDLARLRTKEVTENYVNFLGADYKRQGLPNFFNDFRDSMYAAWTTDELRSTIPKGTQRVWCHFYPRLLPSVQFIIGLPVGREDLFVRKGVPWTKSNSPIQPNMQVEWQLARLGLVAGHLTKHRD